MMDDNGGCVRHTYEEGLCEGRLAAIEAQQSIHATRLDKMDGRVSKLEIVAYTLAGCIAMVQFAPTLREFLG